MIRGDKAKASSDVDAFLYVDADTLSSKDRTQEAKTLEDQYRSGLLKELGVSGEEAKKLYGDLIPKLLSSEILDQNIKNNVDAVVSLNSIEERVIIGQGFMVTNASWNHPDNKMVLFFVLQPGGIKIYIPKLLVTGPYNAGKSSFVKSISNESISVDRIALEKFPTTIAMDIGHVDHDGFIADIFGTPGQERFDLMLDILAREAVGAFIMVDSSAPQTFGRAKEMINKTQAEAIPKIIVANKQDLPGALSPEKIRDAMKLDDTIPIVPTIVIEDNGVDLAMETLLKQLYGD